MKLFSLLYQGDVHPASNAKIIRSEEFSALLSAQEIVLQAQEDSKRCLQEASQECEKLKEQATKEGFEEGLSQFNTHLAGFETNLQHLSIDLQRQILPLALKAAKKIVSKEIELHPETIVDIVIQTLTPVMQNHNITIYVNKTEKDLLETHKPQIKALLDQVQTFSIQERNDISAGGCIIETESGIINASIENQWRALESAFEKYMKP